MIYTATKSKPNVYDLFAISETGVTFAGKAIIAEGESRILPNPSIPQSDYPAMAEAIKQAYDLDNPEQSYG